MFECYTCARTTCMPSNVIMTTSYTFNSGRSHSLSHFIGSAIHFNSMHFNTNDHMQYPTFHWQRHSIHCNWIQCISLQIITCMQLNCNVAFQWNIVFKSLQSNSIEFFCIQCNSLELRYISLATSFNSLWLNSITCNWFEMSHFSEIAF